MATMLLQPVVCLVVFRAFFRDGVNARVADEAGVVARLLAGTLRGELGDDWHRVPGALVDSLQNDTRIAFVVVADSTGRLLHAGVFDSEAWRRYTARGEWTRPDGSLKVDHAQPGVQRGPIQIAVQPIGLGQGAAATGPQGTGGASASGYVLVGMKSGVSGHVTSGVLIGQAAAIGLTCALFLPVIALMVRRWNRPVRELLDAIDHLGRNDDVRPITVRRDDEFGFLGGAFNDMAAKLMASHRELREANLTLEDKVRQRTRQLEEAANELDELASTDSLTSLANRREFENALKSWVAQAQAGGDDLLCLLMDLDGFKLVNDRFGHEVGDKILVAAARSISRHRRESDLAARLGGDEFVMLLRGTDRPAAERIAQSILDGFTHDAAELLDTGEAAPPVSMSIGLSWLGEDGADSDAELLRQADQALYHAKGSGKAILCIYQHAPAA